MTIKQGMAKLAKKLGNNGTFAIFTEVWNGLENDFVDGDYSVNYKVWDGKDHYNGETIAKAVNLCIAVNSKPKTQDPDTALEGVA